MSMKSVRHGRHDEVELPGAEFRGTGSRRLRSCSDFERPLRSGSEANVNTDAVLAEPRSGALRRVRDVTDLLKLRVNVLVAVTAACGFYLATPAGSLVSYSALTFLLVGTFVLGCAASALNQVLEWPFDRCMARTVHRPIAAGRLGARVVSWGTTIAVVLALGALALGVNVATALLGALTVVLYGFVYTPLKRLTPRALEVGAVAGALPPVMGWVAAGTGFGVGAWVLFGILFLWQIPHFHSIAWIYREDYRRGGFRMLAVVRPDGVSVAIESVLYAIILVVLTLTPPALGLAEPWMLGPMAGLGTAFLAATIVFALRRTTSASRWLLWTSLLYLPAVLVTWLLAADGLGR